MLSHQTIKNDIANKTSLINNHMKKLVPEEPDLAYNVIFQAARYSLLSKGKRLRPLFTLITTELFKGDITLALSPACALEMIHTYSLIHDDLPCMDDDDIRRGNSTLHKVFPESYAVLAGDFLLTYAFEVISTSPNISCRKKNLLITTLAKRSGAHGMIGGQILDIANEGKSIDADTLQSIYIKKTSALFIAAFEYGGIIANVNSNDMALLRNIGEKIGLAFQIIDDILDITSTDIIGKTTTSDIAKNKATYPACVGIDESQKVVTELEEQALDILAQLPGNHEILAYLIKHIINRKF